MDPNAYRPPGGDAVKGSRRLQIYFPGKSDDREPPGVSTGFDSSDDVLLLAAIAVDESEDRVAWCRSKIETAEKDFEKLRTAHVSHHRHYFRRVSFSLKHSSPAMAENMIAVARRDGIAPPALFERAFHLGRYLAISARTAGGDG